MDSEKSNKKTKNIDCTFVLFWIKYISCSLLEIILNMVQFDNIYNFYEFLFPNEDEDEDEI